MYKCINYCEKLINVLSKPIIPPITAGTMTVVTDPPCEDTSNNYV